ncbi:hypothetical protein DFJ74DRAFT_676484 [Hyaloraphidium curvatum]|nr:hypothetical protein DFJ74DRAFT_676484 [Hyaloraphidium curvatum]
MLQPATVLSDPGPSAPFLSRPTRSSAMRPPFQSRPWPRSPPAPPPPPPKPLYPHPTAPPTPPSPRNPGTRSRTPPPTPPPTRRWAPAGSRGAPRWPSLPSRPHTARRWQGSWSACSRPRTCPRGSWRGSTTCPARWPRCWPTSPRARRCTRAGSRTGGTGRTGGGGRW